MADLRYSFSSASMDQGRLAWHPAVHAAANEECSFFLIRVRDPSHRKLNDEFSRALESAQISSACVYVTLGYFDVLLRVWANRDRRKAFLTRLEDLRGDYILDIREMRIDQALYDDDLYSRSPDHARPTQQLANDHWDKIREIALIEGSKSIAEIPALQRTAPSMLRNGMLIWIPPIRRDKLKFYVAFEYAGYAVGSISSDFRSGLIDRMKTLRPVAMYEGSGFGVFMVKALADGLQQIAELNDSLIDFASHHGFRPMTIVMASRNAIEHDALDTIIAGDYTGSIRRMLDALRYNYPEVDFRTRSEAELGAAANVFANYLPKFAADDDRRLFLGLLKAALEDDVETLGGRLSFQLASLEFLFLQYVNRRLLPRIGGGKGKWFMMLRTWLEEAKSADAFRTSPSDDDISDPADVLIDGQAEWKKPDKEWTLYNAITAARIAMQHDANVQVMFTQELGPDALQRLTAISSFRNDVAHGRLLAMRRPLCFRSGSPVDLEPVLRALEVGSRLSHLPPPSSPDEGDDG